MTDLPPDPPSKAERDEDQRKFVVTWDAFRRMHATLEVVTVVFILASLCFAVFFSVRRAWPLVGANISCILGAVGWWYVLHLAGIAWTQAAVNRVKTMSALDLADAWRQAYQQIQPRVSQPPPF